MNKKLKKALKIAPILGVAALLVTIIPLWILAIPVLAYLTFGVIDVSRNELTDEAPVWKSYFVGNGLLTWLLSPFNLLMDLLAQKKPGVLQLSDLPEDCQREITDVISVVTREKDNIVERMQSQMADSKRVMLLFKWYGRQVNDTISDFNKDYKYMRTIGISLFNANAATTYHFGPLRITYRVLYNLTPVESDDVFIQVGRTKHIWRDEPLFIFDDTLMHRSVNGSDQPRYCLFADIMRPSVFSPLNSKILDGIGVLLKAVNRIFYKNWDFIT